MALPYAEYFTILTLAVFNMTDRRTDGRAIAYSARSIMLSQNTNELLHV